MQRSVYQRVKQFFSRALESTTFKLQDRWRTPALFLGAFFLLSILMTWPLITQLDSAIPSQNRGDQWMHQWTFWWINEAISKGQDPFYTRLLYYPNGISLTTHNIAWLNAFLWIPLQALLGGFVATNLIYIGLYALNGFAMYLLVRQLTGSQPAAFIAGLIFAFWPYLMSQAGHPNMIVAFWLPLTLYFLNRTLENKRILDAVLTGVFLAIGGIGRWQLLIVGGILIGLYLLYRCLSEAHCRTKRMLMLLLLTGLVAVLLMAPFAIPIVATLPTIALSDELFREPGRTADALGYIVPNLTLTVWGSLLNGLPERLQYTHDQMEFIGITTLVLAIYGSVTKWKTARFWVFMVLVYLVLALGSVLEFGDVRYPQVPMPYRLVEDLFFFRILQASHRFNTFLGLPVAMLVALGVANLLSQLRNRRHGRKWTLAALTAAIGVLILAEYLMIPYPTSSIRTPAWYNQLSQEPGMFGVIDLPMDSQFRDKWYMQFQTIHGKALVEGHVSRVPRDAREFLNNSPILKGLKKDDIMDPELTDITRQLRPLVEADIRYLILHKRFARPDQLEDWRDWLVFEPIYEDGELAVYRTNPKPGEDFELTHTLGDHVGLIEASYEPTKVTQGGLLWITTQWATDDQPSSDYHACIALMKQSGEPVETKCQALLEDWPTSQWAANELVRGGIVVQAGPFTDPGPYTLTLSLQEEDSGAQVGQVLSLGTVEIEALPRMYELPEPAHMLNFRWADLISLPGYDLQVSDTTLSLTLYWRALKRIPSSYKVFAHVVDQSTGAVLAQTDTVPRDWTHPTNWWDSGEVVKDTLQIPVEKLSPGQYQLQVGLYQPDTGERLPVYSAEGEPYPDSAAPLSIINR